MAGLPNYYEILGVKVDATAAQIRRAYLRRAKECHPDASPSPDSASQFARLSQAYETLSDAKSRREYDNRQSSLDTAAARPHYSWQSVGAKGHAADSDEEFEIQDIFETFYGSRLQGRTPPRT